MAPVHRALLDLWVLLGNLVQPGTQEHPELMVDQDQQVLRVRKVSRGNQDPRVNQGQQGLRVIQGL